MHKLYKNCQDTIHNIPLLYAIRFCKYHHPVNTQDPPQLDLHNKNGQDHHYPIRKSNNLRT